MMAKTQTEVQSPHEGHDIIVLSTAMFLVCPGYVYIIYHLTFNTGIAYGQELMI